MTEAEVILREQELMERARIAELEHQRAYAAVGWRFHNNRALIAWFGLAPFLALTLSDVIGSAAAIGINLLAFGG